MERDLTTGSVFKTVIYFSLPYLLSYFLQTLYGMADLFIVGQFGSYDRGACNGSDGYDRTMHWCERLQESSGDNREYCDDVHGNCDHTYDHITGSSQTDRQCDVYSG